MQLGFIHHNVDCIGCRSCEIACKDKNDLPAGPRFRRVLHIEGHYSNENSSNFFAPWRDLPSETPGAGMTGTGIHMVGCNGKSTIESGTGRFSGVKGGGPFTVRTSQREITQTSTAIVDASASGIIFWKGFKYTTP